MESALRLNNWLHCNWSHNQAACFFMIYHLQFTAIHLFSDLSVQALIELTFAFPFPAPFCHDQPLANDTMISRKCPPESDLLGGSVGQLPGGVRPTTPALVWKFGICRASKWAFGRWNVPLDCATFGTFVKIESDLSSFSGDAFLLAFDEWRMTNDEWVVRCLLDNDAIYVRMCSFLVAIGGRSRLSRL